MLNVDVITFGETMLRLSPPHYQLIAQAQSVELHVAGSESNVAVGLANLGINTAWFSALPDNPPGHKVKRAIASYGVDTSATVMTAEGRLGLYWTEIGAPPRQSQVTYDRQYTAISQMTPDMLPENLFSQDKSGVLHISGITPALGESAKETTMELANQAKQAGWRVSFDLNYRSKLWDAPTAKQGCHPFLTIADIIFAPYRDIQQVFEIQDTPEQTFAQFRASYPQALLVMTMGADGAYATFPDTEPAHASAYQTTAIDRIGAGDSFVAGFLSQLVEQGETLDLSTALKWGNACAALKYTIVGDMPLLDRAHVVSLIEKGSNQHIVR